jgi:hypothetical protein
VDDRGWDRGHPNKETLRAFADGELADEQDVAIEEHLMFACDGRCCKVLHAFPNAIDAVLRAAARRYRPGRRW